MSTIENEAWVEAVARALCKADGWTSRDVAHAWKAYRSLARGAIRALDPLISAGKIRLYSCDSVGGQAWFEKSSPEHKMWMQHQFHQWVKHEVVPAIRMDSGFEGPLWTAGASIGAFHAAASVCRTSSTSCE